MKFFKLIGCIFILSMLVQSCIEDDELNPCREPRFTIKRSDNPNMVVATADFEGIDDVAYSWFVNDSLVQNMELSDNRINQFDFLFPEAGTYTICLVIFSEDCDQRLEFCVDITIERDRPCFEPEFEIKETDRPDLFKFVADFEGIDSLVYGWYVDGELVEVEELGDKRDNLLIWDFEPGVYEVCIIVRADVCQNNLEFCKRIEVEAPKCPELSFTATEDPENVYLFEANFEGKEELRYKWFINDDLVDTENIDSTSTDHQLFWQFSPGEYNVCIVAVTDRCEELEFCMFIVAEEPPGCPDLFFEKEKISDRNYKFFADFEGIDSLEWYGWFINDELIENEGTMNNGDNYLNHVFTEEGTYEVCLMTETPDCPRGTTYCTTIEVQFNNPCKTLSFKAEKEPNIPAYTFTADFDGRDDVTYIWSVYVNDDLQGSEVRHAGSNDDHEFYWQFQPGEEYLVCLRQDGADCANYKVCKEIMIN